MLSPDEVAKLERALPNMEPDQRQEALRLLEEYALLAKQDASRNHFIDYVRYVWPAFIESGHHRIMAEAFDRVERGECKRLIINMAPRHRLSLDTPILCVHGWETVETIQPGHFVFGPDGNRVEVTGKSEVYEEELYEVTTTDGHAIVCDGTHLWTVSSQTRGHRHRTFKTYSTAELYEAGWRHGPYLPDYEAIRMPKADLPIDPYVLGVWLGDGSIRGATIGCATADEPEMRRLIEACGYETSDRNGYQMFGILGLHVQLRKAGLLNNKHIPEAYFTASVEQRLALIQGLMDTDGSVASNGRCTFHQKDTRLAEDFCSLVNSLGVRASVTTRTDDTPYGTCTSHRVAFRMPGAARLSRKAERLPDRPNQNNGRSISIVKLDRTGPVACIEVANEDGLFLAGRNFVVTHNTKSEFASHLFPAYCLGKDPTRKLMQTSNTTELAVGFGRKVRNLVHEDIFRDIFPDCTLSSDSKAAQRWHTEQGGEYYATGVGGALAGRGADILIIDDPHSEQEARLNSLNVYDSAYEWYMTGPRQRLQPGGSIVVVMTRWHKMDLTGRVLDDMVKRDGSDQWEIIELPAIVDEYTEKERPIWPTFWTLEELHKTRASLPVQRWSAQYQQKPHSRQGALVKQEWWKKWDRSSPPPVSYIIQSWDTAYTAKQNSDYSACSTWGVFEDDRGENALILLDAFKERLEFPDLKQRALELYDTYKPDTVLIEAKAAGWPLIYELRAMGIPVTDVAVSRVLNGRANDKVSRVNAVTDIFSSGKVWAPDTRFAEEMITEFMEFPYGDHDDLLDTATMAISRFREGGFLRLPSDEEWARSYHRPRVANYY